jgi:hypothetical protein
MISLGQAMDGANLLFDVVYGKGLEMNKVREVVCKTFFLSERVTLQKAIEIC